MSIHVGESEHAPAFAKSAKTLLANTQLRRNVRRATDIIRGKRAKVVGEMPDWEQLRESAKQIKTNVLRNLDQYLEQFEANCTKAGGHVHWANDADDANRIAAALKIGDMKAARNIAHTLKGVAGNLAADRVAAAAGALAHQRRIHADGGAGLPLLV